jgi:hypothetical protein
MDWMKITDSHTIDLDFEISRSEDFRAQSLHSGRETGDRSL